MNETHIDRKWTVSLLLLAIVYIFWLCTDLIAWIHNDALQLRACDMHWKYVMLQFMSRPSQIYQLPDRFRSHQPKSIKRKTPQSQRNILNMMKKPFLISILFYCKLLSMMLINKTKAELIWIWMKIFCSTHTYTHIWTRRMEFGANHWFGNLRLTNTIVVFLIPPFTAVLVFIYLLSTIRRTVFYEGLH